MQLLYTYSIIWEYHSALHRPAGCCEVMVKDYGALFKDDASYAAKAAKVAGLTRDLSEILATEDLSALRVSGKKHRLAFHTPCTLQHVQKLTGAVESILMKLGFELTEIRDGHLCCGSAGSYSLLQPELPIRLRDNKVHALQAEKPE